MQRRVFSLHVDTQRRWRGGQRQLLLTVQGLRAAGHRAFLVAHPQSELFERMSEGHDLVGLAPRHEVDLAGAWRLSRLLQKLQPDLVHAHDAHAVAMAALAISFGTGETTPALVASRRVSFHLKPHSLSRWKYRQVDRFLAASDAIGHVLQKDGIPPDRIVTVHDGIDVDRVQQTAPANIHAEFWLPTNAPIVGHVAALTPEKGQRYLIDAVPSVLPSVPDAHVVIVGDGKLRANLEQQIHDRHLDKHVIFAGFRPDVLSFHRAFDVFVLASTSEGLGSSLLDAMAASRPVVATRTGGILEVVADGDTGILVPPRDPPALAAAIVRLLQDPSLRDAMGRAGLARVRARFGVDRMVRETLENYEDVLARRRRSAPG